MEVKTYRIYDICDLFELTVPTVNKIIIKYNIPFQHERIERGRPIRVFTQETYEQIEIDIANGKYNEDIKGKKSRKGYEKQAIIDEYEDWKFYWPFQSKKQDDGSLKLILKDCAECPERHEVKTLNETIEILNNIINK